MSQLTAELDSHVDAFVRSRLHDEVGRLEQEIKEATESGETSYKKSWQVDRGQHEPMPFEELTRYNALRSAVAEHFAERGFSISTADGRNGRPGHEIMGVDLNDTYVPDKFTDHILSLTVSWADR